MSPPRRDPLERFLEKVDKDHPSGGCWLWLGKKQPSGYGGFWNGEFDEGAHRFSYRTFCAEIPDGFHVHHLCRNPSCVNPAHLQAVTPLENFMSSDTPQALNAKKTHCNFGHALSGDNLHIRVSNGARVCKACDRERSKKYYASKYGSKGSADHEPTVSAMRNGGAL